jgi:uncharacterized membrane-anchored protein YhcB (DUF1043 family)
MTAQDWQYFIAAFAVAPTVVIVVGYAAMRLHKRAYDQMIASERTAKHPAE